MKLSEIIALVALALSVTDNLVAVGRFVGQINGLEKMINYRLDRLETKQDKYNHLQERVAILERDEVTALQRIEKVEKIVYVSAH